MDPQAVDLPIGLCTHDPPIFNELKDLRPCTYISKLNSLQLCNPFRFLPSLNYPSLADFTLSTLQEKQNYRYALFLD